ncbi:MAG: hypothetical protein R3B47_00525 [Bacteroidia bacterium]
MKQALCHSWHLYDAITIHTCISIDLGIKPNKATIGVGLAASRAGLIFGLSQGNSGSPETG